MTLVRPSPVNDGSYRDWDQRSFLVEYALKHSLCRNNNLAADLSQRLDEFSPRPLNAAADAQRIFRIH
jgi:hypothetical protein